MKTVFSEGIKTEDDKLDKTDSFLISKFRVRTFGQFMKDIFGGIIVALISIPISMGYAQIAGLPMQYGLYGSVFTIIIYEL